MVLQMEMMGDKTSKVWEHQLGELVVELAEVFDDPKGLSPVRSHDHEIKLK